MQIRLATTDIQRDSVVDGEGIRSVIWTQGCSHNCEGCHNPTTHSFTAGYLVDVDKIKDKIKSLEGQDGITLSGGDPMFQAKECAEIARYCHEIGLNVWCYTGFTYEELLKLSKNKPEIMDLLSNIDVLIDGKFILKEKSFDVKFRGSKNQRVIDVPKSLSKNQVCLKEGYDNNVEKEEVTTNRKKYMFV